MADHNDLGKSGEQIAKNFLEAKGFHILASNYRYKHAEVDLICLDKKEIVFVEVKTRQSNYLVDPVKAISRKKQKLIVSAAHQYIIDHERNEEARFDIVIVISNSKQNKCYHTEDAFGAF